MASNFGTYARPNPRIRLVRNYPGNETNNLTMAAPVLTGVTILSGQVISLVLDATTQDLAWRLGPTVGQTSYFAFHDSTDPDVRGSGRLLGFSCAGDYEIQTGWFTIGTAATAPTTPVFAAIAGYTNGIPLFGTATGMVTLAGAPAGAVGGIIGYGKIPPPTPVTGTGYSAQAVTTGVTTPNGALLDVHFGDSLLGTYHSFNSEAQNNNGTKVTVLSLVTRWNGA